MNAVSVAVAGESLLGESPIWHRADRQVIWVDTQGGVLHRFDPLTGHHRTLTLPAPLAFVREAPDGGLVIGTGCHIERIDRAGRRQRIATAPHAQPGYRFNDACFDACGRLWVGLINDALTAGSGYLYCLSPDGRWQTIEDGFTLINGLAWRDDQRMLYITDSLASTIYACPRDPLTGRMGICKPLVTFARQYGKPDGLVVDREGYLISVLFDGAAVARISPDGKTVRWLPLPVPRPTSCTFDGSGTTLYMTSARLGLSARQLALAPWSGSLLKVEYAVGDFLENIGDVITQNR